MFTMLIEYKKKQAQNIIKVCPVLIGYTDKFKYLNESNLE